MLYKVNKKINYFRMVVEGYCMKEKKTVQIKDPVYELNAAGKPVVRGKCTGCGTTVYKILGKADTPANLLKQMETFVKKPSAKKSKKKSGKKSAGKTGGSQYKKSASKIGGSHYKKSAHKSPRRSAHKSGKKRSAIKSTTRSHK